MLKKTPHIIQKQSIGVEFQNISGPIDSDLKEQVAEMTKRRLLPAIENLFNDYGTDKYFVFEKLEIDAGTINFDNWQNELTEQVINKLKEKLTSQGLLFSNQTYSLYESKTEIRDEKTRDAEILLCFIKTGRLPWYSGEVKQDYLTENLEVILNNTDEFFVVALKKILNENSSAVKRLAYQFTGDQLTRILLQLSFPFSALQIIKTWATIMNDLAITKQEQKKIAYVSAFSSVIDEIPEQALLKTLSEYILSALAENDRQELRRIMNDEVRLKKWLDELNQPAIIEGISMAVDVLSSAGSSQSEVYAKQRDLDDFNKKRAQQIDQTIDGENFYISNSGLVILHPFLANLFENTGYLQNKRWINEEMQQRAIALTNFLVTGSLQLPEFDLLLNKIICGCDIQNPIPNSIDLNDLEKMEANDLLQAVIQHWTALKNTSIDGLRSTFFTRDGKLFYRENTWHLQVERKAYDILLDKVPWSISIIKLPWMPERLMVEWGS